MHTIHQVTPRKIAENKDNFEEWTSHILAGALGGQVWMDTAASLCSRFQLKKVAQAKAEEIYSLEWDTKLIEQVIFETLEKAESMIPLQNVRVTVVPAVEINLFNIEDRSLWTNAFTNGPHNIIIAIPPKPDLSFLRYLIAHEAHHASELNPIYNMDFENISLADWLKLEGTAEYFSLSLYPDKRWWKESYTKHVKEKLVRRMNDSPFSTDPVLLSPFTFGAPKKGIPYLTGYSFAYDLVKQYINQNPIRNWKESFDIPPEELVKKRS